MTARMSVPCPERPELAALIERTKQLWGTLSAPEKAELIQAQRRSWVIGEMLLEHPEMTREYAEWILDQVTT